MHEKQVNSNDHYILNDLNIVGQEVSNPPILNGGY